MADKKMLSTIVKKLDRAIGVLDNCCDTGEMSEATRMRLIEMLNSAVMDIYYIGTDKGKPSDVADEPATTVVMDTALPLVEDEVPAIEPENAVETEVAAEPVAPETEITAEPVADVHDDNAADELINNFLNNHQSEQEVSNPLLEPVQSTEIMQETVTGESVVTQSDEVLFEIETPSAVDYFGQETELQSVTQQQPISVEDQNIESEKIKLLELRNQLEQERKRLEEELSSWQREKTKREEEMLAAERLLAALESETQKRKQATVNNQVTPDPVVNVNPVNNIVAQPTPQPVVTETPVQQPVMQQPIVQPVQPAPTLQPVVVPNQPTTVAQKLAGNKQFLHETYESEELRLQGITPIPDLTKAIGINDKFQFIKELFGGDSDRYTDTVRTLNTCNSLQEAINYINTEFNWDKNNDAVKRMILLVRRRYM